MKTRSLFTSALLAVSVLAGIGARADTMASIAITPATGVVTLAPRWAIGGGLAGFHHMAQDLSLGGGANQFYSIKGAAIPSGGDVAAFTRYIAASGAATNHTDLGSKLTPTSYSALTSADPDVGYGSVNLYVIHHKASGDYFTAIVPSSATASAVTDLKPMSGPGGPATLGASGYFGLTFAAANLGYGLNNFYYLRTDSVTGFAKFGVLEPALLGTSSDKFDLGTGGFNALAFTGTNVGFGSDKMYYLRLDPITGYTVFGTLNPTSGRVSDVANLGGVYSTLTFVPGDVGFGPGQFYATGAINNTWQSVSFAAIADRVIGAGSFTVAPSASSGLPIVLTVAGGSTGAASISSPVGGVFTITPTAPGLVTLQARQAGQTAPTAYAANHLRQSFTATGFATLVITTQPISKTAGPGGVVDFSVAASGTSTVSYQWRKAGVALSGNTSSTTPTLTLTNVQTFDGGDYDVVVTNASGSIPSDTVTLAVTGAAPVISGSPLTVSAVLGESFSFAIPASGSPGNFTANPLPAGLSLNAATGVIAGTPTSTGVTSAALSATNSNGTSPGSLTITVNSRPAVTTQPLSSNVAAGGTAFLSAISTGSPAPSHQWMRNGVAIPGATGGSLALSNFQSVNAGAYSVAVTNVTGTVLSQSAIVGVLSSAKVIGAATEIMANVAHPNGRVYDQVLLTGNAATITADAGQLTRLSFVDLNDDIVQVEFNGAGALTLTLENSTGPALASKYNQPGVMYMRGHASIVVSGANESTHLSVYSIGTLTAIDHSIFRAGITYAGLADLGLVSIASANGAFGGLRTANVGYFHASGLAGVYAPAVQFAGPVYVGDITAYSAAGSVLIIGSSADTRIAGGDLLQINGQPVAVRGLTQLRFVDGTTSHNVLLPARRNQARLLQDGVDVTSQIVVNPAP